jgi:acyl-ACP thioesterase
MMKYKRSFTVTSADIHKDYRISPHAVLLFFQESFARYMACLRLGAFDLVKEGRMWIITEMSAELPPLDTFWGDEVEVTIWVSEISPLRVYADYFITNLRTGEQMAKGTSSWSLMNAGTRQLESTEEVAKIITVVPEMMTDTHRKMRFPKGGEQITQVSHKVNRTDLDFNKHVNNRSYLKIAMLTATDEFIAENRPLKMVIHWQHETYLDETLTCSLFKTEDNTFVHKLTKEDGTVAAEIFSTWQPFTCKVDVAEVVKRI